MLNDAAFRGGGIGGSPGGSSGAIGGLGGGAAKGAAGVVGFGLGAWGAYQVWDGYGSESSDADTSSDIPEQYDDDDKRCKNVKKQCIDECRPLSGQEGRMNQGQPYLKCIADCMIRNGCSVW